jgi:ATP-dependent Clp protease adapter protein ClpS
MMIFALTIAVVELRGMPQTVFGGGLVTSFTALNAFVLVSNLIPTRTPKGFATDGYVLWKLLRHLTGHHPNPVPAFVPVAESPIFPPDTSLLAMPGLIPRGFTTGIEVLNDAKTPMLFVVETLARHLKISSAEATALMLNVHAKGGMLIGLPKDEARAVAEGVRADALASGHPLICRAVEMECQRDG